MAVTKQLEPDVLDELQERLAGHPLSPRQLRGLMDEIHDKKITVEDVSTNYRKPKEGEPYDPETALIWVLKAGDRVVSKIPLKVTPKAGIAKFEAGSVNAYPRPDGIVLEFEGKPFRFKDGEWLKLQAFLCRSSAPEVRDLLDFVARASDEQVLDLYERIQPHLLGHTIV